MGKRQQKHNGFASNARNSTKGTTRDTLNRQTPVKRNLSDELIENLVSSNELAKTILNAPIEDVLKNGLKIPLKGEECKVSKATEEQVKEILIKNEI